MVSRSSFGDVTIRRIELTDIPSVLALSSEAGWNQTARDWRTLIELEPDGCFAFECDGSLVATATLLCYGEELAWLGMVLTRADYRRRGFARRLVEAALEFADARKVRTVKLDATSQGQPLYESLGFRAERDIERWVGRGEIQGDATQAADWGTVEGLDREAFGLDRSRLLGRLWDRSRSWGNGEGFLLSRPGTRAPYLGPFVARTWESAGSLIRACLAAQNGPCFWDLFPDNQDAVELAREVGFSRARSLVRMYRGDELHQDSAEIYGIAGFEFG